MMLPRAALLLVAAGGLVACPSPGRVETTGDASGAEAAPGDVGPGADADGDGAPPSDGGAAQVPAGPPSRDAVVALVRRGESRRALDTLEELPEKERSSDDLRYLRGRLLERLGQPGDAADAFEGAGAALPAAVANDARERRVILLAEAGRCRDVREAVGRERTSRAARSHGVRFAAAECALRLGDHDAAIQGLQALSSAPAPGVDTVKVRRDLGEALAKAGRTAEAQKVLRSVLVDAPEHTLTPEVAKRLASLGAEPELTTAERLARAKRLLRRRRFESAVEELDRAGRPARWAQRARWLHLRGMALYRSRQRYAEAARVLAEAARYGGGTAVDDEFHAARALSRADRDDDAIAAYLRLVKSHPNHDRAVQAEYLAAWLDMRQGRKRGQVRMEQFLAGPRARKSARYRREAVWHLGLRAYRDKRWARAVSYFNRYAKAGKGGLVRGRGLYWQGRAFEGAGRVKTAATSYQQAISVEPLHWYALLARARLEALGAEAGDPFAGRAAPRLTPSPLPETEAPADVAFYSSLGLDDDAVAALGRQELSVRSQAPRGRELETLAHVFGNIGGHRRAFRLASTDRDRLRLPLGPSTRWVWEASYPRPYEAMVTDAARRHGVASAHVYATMRQESGYQRNAVSHADAIGLLQVLPSTAEGVAKSLGVRVTRQQLFDPYWNIRLGVAEIASVHEALGKQMPLTIAAYNAGAPRVRRWLAETGEVDLDLFVELIPFDETRNYVRRVTSHYARYRYLDDPAGGWPEVPLPQKVGPLPAD